MVRRTDFKGASTYTGQKLKGECSLSYKIDGVRILSRGFEFVTRNDKSPPGLRLAMTLEAKAKVKKYGDVEVYKGSFVASNSPMQQHTPEIGCIDSQHIFPLDYTDDFHREHCYDERLHVGTFVDPTRDLIRKLLQEALDLGYEGLVIRAANGKWYRVKPEYTADVYITGWFEQEDIYGEPKGQLGGFTTAYGKVTAFTDEMRVELWDNPEQYVGQMMTVRYKELYPSGSFRYCVKFMHLRSDKDEEAFDTKAGEIVSW